MQRRYRIVVATPGLDGPDRGVRVIARALREAGIEVVTTDGGHTPVQLAETVIEEDADAVGLAVSTAAHLAILTKVLRKTVVGYEHILAGRFRTDL